MKLTISCSKFFLLALLLCFSALKIKALANETNSNLTNPKLNDAALRICPQDLPRAIEEVISHPKFKRSRWGIEIQTLDDGKSIFSLNGNKFFIPASSAKILTSAAVLSELGANYRLITPIFKVGDSSNLSSLRVKAQGDPTISTNSLKAIVHQLQREGIKKIEKLIIDDSYFLPPRINPTWEWLDIHSYYATAVNSAILNQNSVSLTLLPQSQGEPVKFYWSDAIAARQWQVINEAITGAVDIPYNVKIAGVIGKPVLQIRGELAANESADVWDLAVVEPGNYFLESLRLHLAQAGIHVTQGIVLNQAYQNELEIELMRITSPPMLEILTEINQESNNLYAEAMAQILAKKLNTNTPIEAIYQSLNKLGIKPEEYILVDASGLSRQNLISPQTLVKTLRLMSRSTQGKSYLQSMAISGVNGTLEHRLKNKSIQGKLLGKTGTLSGNASLSGYLYSSDYSPLTLSILLNNSDLSSQEIKQGIDKIIMILNQLQKC